MCEAWIACIVWMSTEAKGTQYCWYNQRIYSSWGNPTCSFYWPWIINRSFGNCWEKWLSICIILCKGPKFQEGMKVNALLWLPSMGVKISKLRWFKGGQCLKPCSHCFVLSWWLHNHLSIPCTQIVHCIIYTQDTMLMALSIQHLHLTSCMIKWEQKEPFDELDFKDYEIMNWLKSSASQTPNKWATKSSVQNYWCKIYIIFTPQQCWVVLKNMKKSSGRCESERLFK